MGSACHLSSFSSAEFARPALPLGLPLGCYRSINPLDVARSICPLDVVRSSLPAAALPARVCTLEIPASVCPARVCPLDITRSGLPARVCPLKVAARVSPPKVTRSSLPARHYPLDTTRSGLPAHVTRSAYPLKVTRSSLPTRRCLPNVTHPMSTCSRPPDAIPATPDRNTTGRPAGGLRFARGSGTPSAVGRLAPRSDGMRKVLFTARGEGPQRRSHVTSHPTRAGSDKETGAGPTQRGERGEVADREREDGGAGGAPRITRPPSGGRHT